jgi:hypothetical protein
MQESAESGGCVSHLQANGVTSAMCAADLSAASVLPKAVPSKGPDIADMDVQQAPERRDDGLQSRVG